MDIDYEARKLKEKIINSVNEFQKETAYKFRPEIEVDMIDNGIMGGDTQYILANVRIKLESEY